MCDRKPRLDFTELDVRLQENGIPITSFSLNCPQVPIPCCISASLIFDRSGSMAGRRLSDAKTAGKAFVDAMDGFCDEAAIISFDTRVTIDARMTSNKNILKQAIDNFQPGGGSAVWDGAYIGIQELIDHGGSSCKTAILLTDGEDNASTRNVLDVISLATGAGIKVMTIGLDVTGQYEGALMKLANETGGKYYKVSASDQLKQIYLEIEKNISNPLPECVATYYSSCPDGMVRTVDVTLDYCGGEMTRQVQFQTPLDTNRAFESAIIKVGEGIAEATQEVFIPLTIESIITEPIAASSVVLQFDEQCMQFTEFITTGYLLQNVPVTLNKIPGGVQLNIQKAVKLNSPGVLALFKFRAQDPDLDVACPISLGAWNFTGGCVKVSSLAGVLRIISRKPIVDCRIDLPGELKWNERAHEYDQNPFPVTVVLQNHGNREARNPKTTLSILSGDVNFYNPTTPTIEAQPRILVRDVGASYAPWELISKLRTRSDTITICATTTFDNYAPISCCAKIFIPPAGALLQCSVNIPNIEADKKTNTYSPMPFPVTVEITNKGGMLTDSIFATIIAPPEFTLIQSDQDRKTKRASPGILLPGNKTSISWSLTHPVITESKKYYITVCSFEKKGDTTCCTAEVTIPGLSVPILNCEITLPDSIVYDDLNDTYVPGPFPASVSVKNTGVLDADSVSATIVLPPEMELFPAGQPLKKYFTPMRVFQWSQNLPSNDLQWSVRAKKQITQKCARVGFIISGYDEIGKRYHESSCDRLICIPPHFISPMACFISAPDSLSKDLTETAYIPNPVNVWATIKNTGRRRLDSVRTVLELPGNEGISLAQGETFTKLAAPFIDPGNSISVGWFVKATEKAIARAPQLKVRSFVKNTNVADSYCVWQMYFPSLKVALSCNTISPDSILFDKSASRYTPNPFQSKLELFNNSGRTLTDIACEISLPPELELVPGDSAQKNISSIPSGQSIGARWNLRLVQSLTKSTVVRISYRYTQNGTDVYECPSFMYLGAAEQSQLSCSLTAPDSILFKNNIHIPDVFDLTVTVRNRGNDAARNIHVYFLSSNNFINLSSSDRRLTDILLPGDSISAQFRLQTKSLAKTTIDSLRIMITADETAPGFCEKNILIQGEDRPLLKLRCSSIAESILYNPLIRDYEPNPSLFTAEIENIGASDARECKLLFVGSNGFVLDQRQSIRDVGDVPAGKKSSTQWLVRTMRRQVASTDTIVFLLQYRGGNSNETFIIECQRAIFVSAAKDYLYEVFCTAPTQIQFADSMYIPSPFTFSSSITNRGNTIGRNVRARLTLPQGLMLATGESLEKNLSDLAAGATANVQWSLTPERIISSDLLRLCVDVVDDASETGKCCSDVRVVKNFSNAMQLSCGTIDTLHLDVTTGSYISNPFRVRATVRNSSSRSLDSVTVLVVPQSSDLVITDVSGATKLAAAKLDQGMSSSVEWQLRAQRRTQSGNVTIRFIASASGQPPTECITRLYIPSATVDLSEISCSSIPADTLRYIISQGAFEHDPFTYRIVVRNAGTLIAKDLRAAIVLPPSVTLADSEQIEKTFIPSNLQSGETASLEWRLKAIRESTSVMKNFRAAIRASNAFNRECTSSIFIQGAILSVDASIPEDLFVKYGESVDVPIVISRASGKGVTSYQFDVSFDTTVLTFRGASLNGTLTETEWASPNVIQTHPGTVHISAYTTGTPLRNDHGVLLKLVFEGSYAPAAATPSIGYSSLAFRSSLINRGDVSVQTMDGKIFVTGLCTAPLSNKRFDLKQNKPNPFNPSTQIVFELPGEMHVKLSVLDQFGRTVQVLVDAVVNQGIHNVVFDASDLSTGIYFCKMEARGFVKIIKMIYQR